MMQKIYIAGPMTGLPEFNYPKFNRVAADLRAAGFDVLSPAENDGDETWTWSDYMRDGVKKLLKCDTILMLHGWENSRGARIEHDIAVAEGMYVATEAEWYGREVTK